MSSPVTLSGFNGIDFGQLLNAVMVQERAPLKAVETRKSTLETQNTQFGTLAGKLSTLKSAVDTLADPDEFEPVTATSGDTTAVGVSTTTGTVEGAYDVVVTELARAQVTASTSTYAATSDVVASAGTLTLTAAGGSPVTVTLAGDTTLQELATAINDTTGSPVTASIVQSAPGSYQLVLTGAGTGTDAAFTITSTLSGGSGLTFGDQDLDGISGDSAADNAAQATNAALTVNNLAITSATNTVTDAIPGVTLSLYKKDAVDTIRVTVARDSADATTKVKAFIDAYNGLVTFVGDQRLAGVAGKANIGSDALVRSLQAELRTSLMTAQAGGTYTRLAGLGIGFDSGGKMTLDTEAFDAAMDASPTDVSTLFSGLDGTSGAFGALGDLLQTYTEAGGLIRDARDRLTTQSRTLARRIDDMDAQLAIRRAALQMEYMAADMAMTRLKNQSSSLSAVGGEYRIF